jgi:hypothetical protein
MRLGWNCANLQVPVVHRPSKAAKALLSWNSEIPMVVELHFLRLQDLVTGKAVDVANIVLDVRQVFEFRPL